MVNGRKWDQGTAPRLLSVTPPCPSPGLQGLKGLMALPQVTQLLHAFVSLVRMRLGLLRVGVGVRVEWSHGRWESPIWKTCAKTTAPPCTHAHSIFRSEMSFPSPSVPLSLRRVSPCSLAFISNHFPAWHHKKNVSNVQTTVFSCLGGPDIITATTSPGLHPNPLLPLAQGLRQRDAGHWCCQRGPRAPGWTPTPVTALPGLGSGRCGAFQSPGCHEASQVWKETHPHSLPAYAPALSCLRSERARGQGRGERGKQGPPP